MRHPASLVFAVLALFGLVYGASARDLVVALDGSGDFTSVQAAIIAAPSDSAARTTIFVRRGAYAELIVVPREKKNLTLRGEDRRATVIAATNNAKLNTGGRRELVSVAADDFILENLTLHNLTPKGGTQAEAIHVRADRVELRGCDFKSFQDTLRLNGRVYARDCYVEGDVDFVWGSGAVYFERCEFKAVYNGYFVQARNGAGAFGYVFVDCKLTATPNVERYVLARIEPIRFPHSHVAFIDCALGPHISPVGWQLDQAPGAAAVGPAPHLRFEEFRSTDLAGRPLDVSARLGASRQLSAEGAELLRQPGHVLGGWIPGKP